MKSWQGNNNAYARRLEALDRARQKWNESESVLRKLRSRPMTELKIPADQTLLEWHQRITSAPFCL